jgi:hypothetical protein
VEEEVVHYYNVILGKIPCGANTRSGEKNYAVFLDRVSCADCLSANGKNKGKSVGSESMDRSAA